MRELGIKVAIHYISFFCDANEMPTRDIVISGQAKMRYMISTLRENSRKLHVVSTAQVKPGMPAEKQCTITVDKREDHVYLPALSTRNAFSAKLRGLFGRFYLLRYLLTKVKSSDVVVVYHSLFYMEALLLFRLLRRNRIVLEFNDQYSLLYTKERMIAKARRQEKSILRIADAFILASPYMRELIPEEKKSIVNYGDYTVEDMRARPDRELVTVAYTGVIEKLRSAAFLAAQSAAFLPDGIKLLIAGFGSDECVRELQELCDNVNEGRVEPVVELVGLLQGQRFDELLNTIDIALNSHSYSRAELWKSRYSFPSKIPLNMAHGAYIVSYGYEIVSDSVFRPACVFFDEYSPESVAAAIIECAQRLPTADRELPKKIVRALDESFRAELSDILN